MLEGVSPSWERCLLLIVMNVGRPLSAVNADVIANDLYGKQNGEQYHLG